MAKLAEKDYLTGFYLRESLDEYLKTVVLESKLKKSKFDIILLDLDHFKKFNDKFGHLFGDEILKYMASTLRLSFPQGACRIFRYGGDEFLIIMPDKDLKDAQDLMAKFRFNMAHRPFLYKNKLFKLTASCGVAGYPIDGDNPEELVKRADQALYFSKRHGRNRTTLASKMTIITLRYILTFLLVIAVILGVAYYSYRYTFKRPIQRALNAMGSVRVSTAPSAKELDLVTLKNGNVLKGKIVKETDEAVVLNIDMDRGSASTVLKREDISNINYAPEPSRETPAKK